MVDVAPSSQASFAANQALWDVWTQIHATGAFYDLEGFRTGGVRLRPYEIEMVGDVVGMTLLHLQCHFGIDTLSWARVGVRVTGADISPAAIDLARSLTTELGFPNARVVQSNLYDLPEALEGTFDVVSASRGALNWLPDIQAWATIVTHIVAPGGIFSSSRGAGVRAPRRPAQRAFSRSGRSRGPRSGRSRGPRSGRPLGPRSGFPSARAAIRRAFSGPV